MKPFERLARRRERWLFCFALTLAIAGMGLAFMALGFVLGLRAPVYAGLVVAAPFSLISVLIVTAAQHVPQKGYDTPETSGRRRR